MGHKKKAKAQIYLEKNRTGKFEKIDVFKDKDKEDTTLTAWIKYPNKQLEKFGEVIFKEDYELPDGGTGNKPPKIVVQQNHAIEIKEPPELYTITATITDQDGTVVEDSVKWTQTLSTPAGIDLGFVVSLDKRSIEFTPTVDKEGDFLVTLEATDNTGATAVSGINIKIRKKIEPEPTDFEIVGVIVGDIDTGSPGNKSMEIMAGPEVISAIPNGDLDYTESDSQDFIDDYDAKTGLKQKTKGATKGNHDAANEDGTDNNETQLSNYFGWQLQPTRLAISAYTEGNVGFIGMDSQDDSIVDTNGVQATFVKTKLEEFKNSGIDFVTICIHKPLYGTTYKHGDETAIRNAYQPIFDQYQVDVVVQAHNHQSWVTHPLRVGGNVEVEKTVEGYYDFAQQHGQIYCGGGAGGEGNYVIGSNVPSYVIFTNDNDYALVYVERNKVDNKLFRLSIVTHQGAVLYKQVIRKGPPAPLPLDAKFAELTKKAVKDSIVVCDGSKSTGGINGDAIVSWDIIQVNRPEEGVPLVTLTNHPTLKFSKQFVMPELDVAQAIKLQLNVTDNAANTDSDIMAVTEQKTPPAGDFPVPTEWFYNSKEVHDSPGHMESSSYYPNADSVCLPSGASGANNHQSQTDGWIDIDSGGGNGRLYWDYAKIALMKAHAKFGKSISFTGVFKLQNGDNLSIKDGNHGTDGSTVVEGMVFGGFGLSFHETEVQSKVEYWHNNQGNEVAETYPGGKKIDRNAETKYFITIVADEAANKVTLNAWLDFGSAGGWEKVMTDREWTLSGWSPGSIPNGSDKADIEAGPGFITRNHIWTRANQNNVLIKDVQIGIPI